ncbi:FecR family protein [Chitinophaga niabensis]|uniref:FecR protein n=1 Tax=Chitinophaga niabensis TaxID=536979 RepID=A0A1N6DI57_9BACT|nr:FecR family protein [Chitinophaga niabensis]SIN70485.1 FecR protein [Chitinophaga niabensis]
MPQEKEHYQQLLQRFLDNNCTPGEAEELLNFLQQNASNRLLLEEMNASFGSPVQEDQGPWRDRVRQQLLLAAQPVKVVPLYKKWWPKVAAAVLLLAVATFGWQHYRSAENIAVDKLADNKRDPLPGGNKAMLTLANGTTVVLDSATNDAIPSQGATKVIRINGQLKYEAGQVPDDAVVYNTLSTPRGGQYKIELPDGTLVWLNAASSLRFPTTFNNGERTVELNGEGYFEVAHRNNMPFKVQLGSGTVEVLGTRFNVMAYQNETTVRTTLLQGAVKVTHSAHSARLIPGQQASWAADGSNITVSQTDADEAVSWKEGYFHFNKAPLADVMQQLQRWYNVEVRYEGNTGKREFWGKIPRNVRLSEALKILELSNIPYSMKGDTIIIHQ